MSHAAADSSAVQFRQFLERTSNGFLIICSSYKHTHTHTHTHTHIYIYTHIYAHVYCVRKCKTSTGRASWYDFQQTSLYKRMLRNEKSNSVWHVNQLWLSLTDCLGFQPSGQPNWAAISPSVHSGWTYVTNKQTNKAYTPPRRSLIYSVCVTHLQYLLRAEYTCILLEFWQLLSVGCSTQKSGLCCPHSVAIVCNRLAKDVLTFPYSNIYFVSAVYRIQFWCSERYFLFRHLTARVSFRLRLERRFEFQCKQKQITTEYITWKK